MRDIKDCGSRVKKSSHTGAFINAGSRAHGRSCRPQLCRNILRQHCSRSQLVKQRGKIRVPADRIAAAHIDRRKAPQPFKIRAFAVQEFAAPNRSVTAIAGAVHDHADTGAESVFRHNRCRVRMVVLYVKKRNAFFLRALFCVSSGKVRRMQITDDRVLPGIKYLFQIIYTSGIVLQYFISREIAVILRGNDSSVSSDRESCL